MEKVIVNDDALQPVVDAAYANLGRALMDMVHGEAGQSMSPYVDMLEATEEDRLKILAIEAATNFSVRIPWTFVEPLLADGWEIMCKEYDEWNRDDDDWVGLYYDPNDPDNSDEATKGYTYEVFLSHTLLDSIDPVGEANALLKKMVSLYEDFYEDFGDFITDITTDW